jgi:hypothetical protein
MNLKQILLNPNTTASQKIHQLQIHSPNFHDTEIFSILQTCFRLGANKRLFNFILSQFTNQYFISKYFNPWMKRFLPSLVKNNEYQMVKLCLKLRPSLVSTLTLNLLEEAYHKKYYKIVKLIGPGLISFTDLINTNNYLFYYTRQNIHWRRLDFLRMLLLNKQYKLLDCFDLCKNFYKYHHHIILNYHKIPVFDYRYVDFNFNHVNHILFKQPNIIPKQLVILYFQNFHLPYFVKRKSVIESHISIHQKLIKYDVTWNKGSSKFKIW